MKVMKILPVVLAAGVMLTAGTASAESTYGYNASGGAANAKADVKVKVSVPTLILLRVGDASGVVNTKEWSVGASIPGVPTAATAGNSIAVDWNGTAPTLTASGVGSTDLVASAWTNGTGAAINCAMGTWTATNGTVGDGPANADFSVTATTISGGGLSHPGANLGACTSTPFASNTLVSSTWAYSLGGTAASWKSGVYENTITYTASSV